MRFRNDNKKQQQNTHTHTHIHSRIIKDQQAGYIEKKKNNCRFPIRTLENLARHILFSLVFLWEEIDESAKINHQKPEISKARFFDCVLVLVLDDTERLFQF